MNRTHLFALVTLSTLAALPSAAAVPDVVTYAGTLNQGTQPANGTFSAVFELFDAATAGNRVFQQAEPSLVVTAGELVVDLGSDPTNPLGDDVLASGSLFLQITVNGEELGPRVAFSSVPFARRAKVAEKALESDSLQGLAPDDIANLVQAGAGLAATGHVFSIADGGVTSAKLAANAVGTAQLADGAVTSTKLAASSVNGAAIVDGSITAADIADGTISAAKFAPSSVSGSTIALNTITGNKLQSGTVTGGNIASATITSANLANNAVGTAQIANGAVTAVKVKSKPVFVAPNVCGGSLMVAAAATDTQNCITIACGIHHNAPSNEVAPTFFTCSGTCTEAEPQTCAVNVSSPIGFLVEN